MPAPHRPSPALALPLLALLLLPAAAGATAYLPLADTTLADRAPVIIEGRVLAVEPAPGSRPATDYLVEIERLIKGALPDGTLVVRVPGGVGADGIGLHIHGAPRFDQGDEVLLFLDPRHDGTFALHQLMLGAFHIETEGDMRLAKRDLSGALRVKLPRTGTKGTPTGSGPRDALAFRRWLVARIAGRVKAADYFLPAPLGGGGDDAFRIIISPTTSPPSGGGCANGGHGMRWFDFTAGDGGNVGWRTHYSGQAGVPDGGIAAIHSALAAWSDDPNTEIRYVYDGLTSATGGMISHDGKNAVLFGDPNNEISGSFDGEGLLAIGGPWFDCDTLPYEGEGFHPIIGADIVTQDGIELFFASTPDPSKAVEQLFAHELGHTIGLAHSELATALMWGDFHHDGRGSTLDADDLAGALYLYGPRDLTPPAAPSQLTATEAGGGQVLLEWSDNSNNESQFRVERRRAETFELVATAAAGETSLIDAGVEPSTLYGYRLRAESGAGTSAYTDVVELMTGEDRRPTAPTNLRAAPLSSTEIRLAWQDNSDNETGFVVEILISLDWVEISHQLPTDTTEAIVDGLPPASRVSFRVRAVNEYGASEPSNVATVETFSDNDACVVTGDELCLLGGRFKVSVDYRNQHAGGAEGTATVVPWTDQSGLFWFFGPENVELIVKMLDGRHINQHFWLFYGALSDLEYTVTVIDTAIGEDLIYHNPPGEICGLADTTAVPAEPEEPSGPDGSHLVRAPPARSLVAAVLPEVSDLILTPVAASMASILEPGTCQPGPRTLCLLDQRLSVEVWWQNPHGGLPEGPGQAILDSDSTGMFWFFNIENTELVVKALDGGALNGHLWFFYGALTDLEYWITVTDTVTGENRVYYNPPGEVCGQADTEAFDADPP